jgi:hypothetical protein
MKLRLIRLEERGAKKRQSALEDRWGSRNWNSQILRPQREPAAPLIVTSEDAAAAAKARSSSPPRRTQAGFQGPRHSTQ